jgi:hypothetical protein
VRPRALLLPTLLVAAACSSFAASESTPPDADAPDAADPDAPGPPPGPGPVDGSAARDADASRCDGGCVLFSDDFERAPTDVRGAWTELRGTPKLIGAGPGFGTVFQGGFGTTASTGTSFREELASKELPVVSGLRIQAKVQVQIFPDGGTFGPGELDYCEFMSVRLGQLRIAILYVDKAGAFRSWLYGPNETPGGGATFATALDTWADVEIALTWTASKVTMATTIAGEAGDPRTEDLSVGAEKLTPSLRIGMRCTGDTPAISSFTDAVVVRSIP